MRRQANAAQRRAATRRQESMAASRKPRRSTAWFGRDGKMGFIYRSWVKNRGVPHDQFDGRPVIGICNTYSELTPCNSHFRTLAGWYKGERIGSGTNTWALSEDLRAGRISREEFHEAESCMHRSHGHCMTMGTASTMASMIEALGVGMPGNAAIPAVDARRYDLARM